MLCTRKSFPVSLNQSFIFRHCEASEGGNRRRDVNYSLLTITVIFLSLSKIQNFTTGLLIMALEDADSDSTVRLLEIYDGAKLMRRLNCTLKCRIFQHIIEGKPDSCIEIVAFLLFHETSDKDRKVVQLERLFLSTQKIFSEVKKALKTRVKITIGHLPFIVDYIYQRVCISSEMQLQLTHFVTQDDGTKLECILDLSFDGLKILAQLPHIDNIK
jgi:hypothetical protein